MNILAIETTSEIYSISFTNNKDIIFDFKESVSWKHAENLLPNIRKLMKNYNLSYSDIDKFCFASGPGSFTGIRVSVAIAKAFKSVFTSSIVCGIPTLKIIAFKNLSKRNKINILYDAKRNEVYYEEYSSKLKVISSIKKFSYESVQIDQNEDYIIYGEELYNFLKDKNGSDNLFLSSKINSLDVASLADFDDSLLENLDALYIRQPDAKKPIEPKYL